MNEIKWYIFPRNSTPEALLSESPPDTLGGKSINDPLAYSSDLVIGYSYLDMQEHYFTPAMLILPDEKAAEILAWLRVYAPETSPLSQFGRVVSHADYKLIHKTPPLSSRYSKRPSMWSSIILGEILAQGEMDLSIETLPLSRSQATFSNAVAQAAILHGNEELIDSCLQRLEKLEKDRKFVTRTLSIRELIPIWRNSIEDNNKNPSITSILKIFTPPHQGNNDLFATSPISPSLNHYPEILSDSVESRVLAYRKLSHEVLALDSPFQTSQTIASLALGAFLVGRSTSHAFLLKDAGKKLPAVYAWFGLIAGVAGPRYWEVDWSRAVRGIEKSLRSKPSWNEPSHSDISWPEYEWLTRTYTNNPLIELPKQLPKVLSLEIIPGSICQLRLRQEASKETTSSITPSINMQELENLRTAISEFINLAEKTRTNLHENGTIKTNNSRPSQAKTSKPAKRVKRSEQN